VLQHDLDVVLHLGDYTYEYAIDGVTRRGIAAPEGFNEETVDLRTYRLRHTLYKLDADLQAAHAKFPFSVIWDDHEFRTTTPASRRNGVRHHRSSRRDGLPRIRRITSTCRFV
jgi:phosphodiesterase/alkaline phosphatase D-like protein